MTQSPVRGLETEGPAEVDSDDEAAWTDAAGGQGRRVSGRRVALTGGIVVVTFVVTVAVVVYGVGPLIHARDQRALTATEQAAISEAATEAHNGIFGEKLPTQPPTPGSPVGQLAIPAIGVNETVVEGAQPAQTIAGPGHVPGTAGLGQPGNAAVVGRNAGFGAPFAKLSQLHRGDRILVQTIEGQSVYVVRQVRLIKLVVPSGTASQGGTAGGPPTTQAAPSVGTKPVGGTPTVLATTLYGPTSDDQLTLVTSDSIVPWNGSLAQTVVARMVGRPFVPTPQEAASPGEYGNTGQSGAWSLFVLALLLLGLTVGGSVFLYRRISMRSAYLLTTAPIVAFTVLAGLSASRLLPAWM